MIFVVVCDIFVLVAVVAWLHILFLLGVTRQHHCQDILERKKKNELKREKQTVHNYHGKKKNAPKLEKSGADEGKRRK